MSRRGRKNTIVPVVDANPVASLDIGLFDNLDPLSGPMGPELSPLSPIEDLRTYHPDGEFRSLMTEQARPITAPLTIPKGPRAGALSARLAFPVDSGKALLCARRKIRREVYFAKNLKRGRGGGRRRWSSDIKC